MENNLHKTVTAHIKARELDTLKELLAQTSAYDLLSLVEFLKFDHQAIVFRLLPKDQALYFFERLDTHFQEDLIRGFTEDAAVEMFEGLDPDERVRLLDELPANFATRLVASLSTTEREKTSLLMGYDIRTAGRIMTPDFVRVERTATVAEALEKLRTNAKTTEVIHSVYVTDSTKKLEAVATLRDLWRAEPDQPIESVMRTIAGKVYTHTDQEETAILLKKLDWLAVPVVDKEERLVGLVTIDDAMDIMEDEATDDILDAAGFADIAGKESDRSEVLTKGSILSIWAVRLPFLLIALAGGIVAGLIMEGFEDILESVVVVAFFIPLIMDMGGSVGTQSTTVFARGVVLGHINLSQFWRAFAKEAVVGLSMGLIMGAISWGVIVVWLGLPLLGLAVALGLAATMTIAAVLGFLVPYLLMRLKVDQAAGSAPIITTLKDLTGILIYFGLVVTILGGDFLEPDYEVTAIHVNKAGVHFVLDPETETATIVCIDGNSQDLYLPERIEVMGEYFYVVGLE